VTQWLQVARAQNKVSIAPCRRKANWTRRGRALLARWPVLRRFGAVAGISVRPEHVHTPERAVKGSRGLKLSPFAST